MTEILRRSEDETVSANYYSGREGNTYVIGHLALDHFWCPYCGGWHGGGPPPQSQQTESVPAPQVPETIGRLVRSVMEAETNVRWKPPAERWENRGEVDGMPADMKVQGDTTKAVWTDENGIDPNNHREIVTHDNLNAVYVRDLNEQVVVDDNQEDPYQPYTRDTSNRYNFD